VEREFAGCEGTGKRSPEAPARLRQLHQERQDREGISGPPQQRLKLNQNTGIDDPRIGEKPRPARTGFCCVCFSGFRIAVPRGIALKSTRPQGGATWYEAQ